VLTTDMHRNTIRFAPPLVISESQVGSAVDSLTEVLEEVASSSVRRSRKKPLARASSGKTKPIFRQSKQVGSRRVECAGNIPRYV
jgi:hypothetical protein